MIALGLALVVFGCLLYATPLFMGVRLTDDPEEWVQALFQHLPLHLILLLARLGESGFFFLTLGLTLLALPGRQP